MRQVVSEMCVERYRRCGFVRLWISLHLATVIVYRQRSHRISTRHKRFSSRIATQELNICLDRLRGVCSS